jgi:RHS repeat-associated protein
MKRHPGLHPALRLRFTYDHKGRRIRKTVEQKVGASYVLTSDTRFLYDGWNLVAEYQMNPSQHSSFDILHSFFWALDLSNTEQGAGGVAGLMLCATTSATQPSQISNSSNLKYTAPVYDGNGNVLSLISLTTNTVIARYEYSAFGETLEMEGGAADANLFRFSTKYTDSETSLLYYGYRYYSPELGRWPNRDPIGINGGLNLYGMVGNDVVNGTDLMGLTTVDGASNCLGFAMTVQNDVYKEPGINQPDTPDKPDTSLPVKNPPKERAKKTPESMEDYMKREGWNCTRKTNSAYCGKCPDGETQTIVVIYTNNDPNNKGSDPLSDPVHYSDPAQTNNQSTDYHAFSQAPGESGFSCMPRFGPPGRKPDPILPNDRKSEPNLCCCKKCPNRPKN